EWTLDDLEAYNIRIAFQDSQFSYPKILTATPADDTADQVSYVLSADLGLAISLVENGDSFIDFSVTLLRSLGHVCHPRAGLHLCPVVSSRTYTGCLYN
ncbi:hypothetical protein EDD16DRAFT_1478167, partial [Pisolithus croceorrhizus]